MQGSGLTEQPFLVPDCSVPASVLCLLHVRSLFSYEEEYHKQPPLLSNLDFPVRITAVLGYLLPCSWDCSVLPCCFLGYSYLSILLLSLVLHSRTSCGISLTCLFCPRTWRDSEVGLDRHDSKTNNDGT